jgi:hypothetical protein
VLVAQHSTETLPPLFATKSTRGGDMTDTGLDGVIWDFQDGIIWE